VDGGVTPDMAILQEEIFGPLLPILGYRDAAEPVAYINQHDRPLALYWFGKDDAARDEVLSRTVSGGVTVNDCLFHFTQINQPMGGIGASGTGAYHGEWGFRTLSKLKPVFYRSPFNRLADLYPPYWRQDRAAGKDAAVYVLVLHQRHCERSEAIHSFFALRDGLLRYARNDEQKIKRGE
jgi:delta 1-pyrroline-5-carboxylate dehydrogenase